MSLARDFLEMPPEVAERLIAELDADEVAALQAELDEFDLEAFVAGREMEQVRDDAERSGPEWMRSMFPHFAFADFAPHMVELWEWVWRIERGARSRPFVAAWFRGGAKSASAEGAVAALGARRRRRYALYVSGTQDQADKHVESLGALLESRRFGAAYPEMAERAVTKYGTSRGWKRNRLHTASGFVVDALGLTVESRGIRVEESRPDLIVLDDVDSLSDGPAAVQKKVDLLTQTILPSGSTDLTVLAIQNIIHPRSIFARLCDLAEERADFLADRIVCGPVPALENMEAEPQPDGGWRITRGTPTWSYYDVDVAQAAVDNEGYTAFMREAQHAVEAAPGGMFDHLSFRRCKLADVPTLVRKACWVDPAVTDKDTSDSQGIQIDGLSADGTLYRLWSWEVRTSPLRALTMAIRMAVEYGVGAVGVETDQGGDTWQSVYNEACAEVMGGRDGGDPVAAAMLPGFRWDKASKTQEAKTERAARMLVDYERANAPVHVEGTHVTLEAALRRFPKTKPLDLVDASFWSWNDLRRSGPTALHAPQGTIPRMPPGRPRDPVAPVRFGRSR